jgi:SAM-dependent methyltransferase
VKPGSSDFMLVHYDAMPSDLGMPAKAFEPITRHFLLEAGIRPGMRVLDFGSGSGDLTFIVADLVGPEGHVVGVEESEQAFLLAQGVAAERRLDQVQFVNARLSDEIPDDRAFDAVVGRMVLMYQPEPVHTLLRLADHLVPGGIVAFQEIDLTGGKTVPKVPVADQALGWLRETFKSAGVDIELGPKLHKFFEDAGLPPPEMRLAAEIGGYQSPGPGLLTNAMHVMLPLIERFGVATSEEVAIDTLEKRIRDALQAAQATMSSPQLIGAWARTPD